MSIDPPDDTLVLRPRVVATDEVLRPTRAEVDLDAIAANLAVVKRHVGRAAVLAVVKADAYGHGVIPVALRLEREGAIGFGVALAEEAIELRDAGVRARVLVLNGVHGGAHREIVERALTPVVYDAREARAFESVPKQDRFPIHVKVDTGMSRLGVTPRELDAFLDALDGMPSLRVEGVMTHLASADVDPEFTRLQLARFDDALVRIRARGHAPGVIHAANSAAAFRHPEARYDMVRVGIALFGHGGADEGVPRLAPAMRLRSAIIATRRIEPGESVGYCGTFAAARPTTVATVPVGYGDGYFRAFSNRGHVLVHGRRCPVVGNVSMDLIGVDVTDAAGAAVGDEVVLLGRQGDESLDAAELARTVDTIPYEILTNVSRRVPRFYVG